MISEFCFKPNIVAIEYMAFEEIKEIDAWFGKMIESNEKLRMAHQQAKEKASRDFADYEDWLCEQAPDPAYCFFNR